MKLNVIFSNNIYSCARGAIRNISLKDLYSGKRNIIIVPDRFSLLAEKMVFDEKQIDCTFTTEVTTLARLASKIIDESGEKFSIVSKTRASAFARKAVLDTQKHFKFFRKQNNSVDFANSLLNSISQLKSSGQTVSDVEKIAGKCESALEKKFYDLALVFARYEELVSLSGGDASDEVGLAIKCTQKSSYIKNADVSFVGFESMTKQGYQLLEKIVQMADGVTVGVLDCPPTQKNNYIFDGEMISKLKDIAKQNDLQIDVRYEPLNNKKCDAILSNTYMFEKTRKIENDHFVKVVSATNVRQEICEVSKLIKEAVMSNKLRYRNISVACGSLEIYGETIKEIFEDFDIPAFIDEGQSLDSLLPSKFISIVFQMLKSGFYTDETLSFISSSLIGLNDEQKFKLIKHLEEYNLFGDSLFVDGKNTPSEINENIKKILTPFNNYKIIVNNSHKIDYFIGFINDFLKYFDINEKILNNIQVFLDLGKLDLAKIYEQSMQQIEKVLEEINQPETYGDLSFDEFRQIFESAISSVKISTVPVSVDRVFVGDATNSFFDKNEYLFIVGANADLLPLSQNDCGIVSDKEIEEVGYEKEIGPLVKVINFRNRQKLLSIFGSVQDRLCVSFLSVADDGKQKFPARFVVDIMKTFLTEQSPICVEKIGMGDSVVANVFLEESNDLIMRDFSSIENAKTTLLKLQKQDDVRLKPLINSVHFALQDIGQKIDYSSRIKSQTISNGKNLFFPQQKTKSSQLETYFKCPFMHFAKYGLCLQEERRKDVDALEIGNILHECAEKFEKEINFDAKTISHEQVKNIANKVFSSVFRKEKYSYYLDNAQFKAIVDLLKSENIRVCQRIVDEHSVSNFTPKYFEKDFGFDKRSKTLFETNGEEISMVGKIDRIDICADGFRIIDYKTGEVDDSLKDIFFGSKIQLFLYAIEWGKQSKQTCKGVFYFPISNKIEEKNSSKILSGFFDCSIDNVLDMDNSLSFEYPISSVINVKLKVNKEVKAKNVFELCSGNKGCLTEKELDNIVQYCEQVASVAVGEMLEGNVEASPVKDSDFSSTCDYCKFRGMCGLENGDKARMRNKKVSIDSFDMGGGTK